MRKAVIVNNTIWSLPILWLFPFSARQHLKYQGNISNKWKLKVLNCTNSMMATNMTLNLGIPKSQREICFLFLIKVMHDYLHRIRSTWDLTSKIFFSIISLNQCRQLQEIKWPEQTRVKQNSTLSPNLQQLLRHSTFRVNGISQLSCLQQLRILKPPTPKTPRNK